MDLNNKKDEPSKKLDENKAVGGEKEISNKLNTKKNLDNKDVLEETKTVEVPNKDKKEKPKKKQNKVFNKKNILGAVKYVAILLGTDIFKFIFKTCEVLVVLYAIVYFFNWSNDSLVVTEDTYVNENIPSDFNGYKILQISDLNNKDGISEELIEKTFEINPDIIVVTGDYINSDRSDEYNIDYTYLENVASSYPTYFVTGEQEQDALCYSTFKEKIEELGVIVLDDESVELEKNIGKITLIGMNDPAFYYENVTAFNNKLKELNTGENFTILLSHRPELFDVYTEDAIPLVLSGHALGGQIKLPFVGELYSSNQGFYPDYTSGFYTQENTTLYVSRGIGNTFIPVRLFNQPEINVITLSNMASQ
jgi:hypothetical protein